MHPGYAIFTTLPGTTARLIRHPDFQRILPHPPPQTASRWARAITAWELMILNVAIQLHYRPSKLDPIFGCPQRMLEKGRKDENLGHVLADLQMLLFGSLIHTAGGQRDVPNRWKKNMFEIIFRIIFLNHILKAVFRSTQTCVSYCNNAYMYVKMLFLYFEKYRKFEKMSKIRKKYRKYQKVSKIPKKIYFYVLFLRSCFYNHI